MALEKRDYDIIVFMCKQALQLCLKATLLRIIGFMSRGRGLRELLRVLSKALEKHIIDIEGLVKIPINTFSLNLRDLMQA
jgi:HEPN domain-containing protein